REPVPPRRRHHQRRQDGDGRIAQRLRGPDPAGPTGGQGAGGPRVRGGRCPLPAGAAARGAGGQRPAAHRRHLLRRFRRGGRHGAPRPDPEAEAGRARGSGAGHRPGPGARNMSLELIVEFFGKSGLVAGVGLLLASLPGFRSAADRVDVLRATVGVILLLPLAAVIAPAFELPILPAFAVETATASAPVWQGSVTPVEGVSLSSTLRPPTAMEILIGVWILGAAAVIGRFVLGVLTLRRWTRAGQAVTDAAWTRALEARAPGRRPRLIAASAVEAPLSWGLPPGVVLVGPNCLSRPETAPAVLAHELAHVRRADWMFLALSRVALALFWFNPLVWLLQAVLASRTEDAADAAAVTVVDRQTYARTLVGLAADFRQPAAIAMTGEAHSLSKRITRIMNARSSSRSRPLTLALAVGAL